MKQRIVGACAILAVLVIGIIWSMKKAGHRDDSVYERLQQNALTLIEAVNSHFEKNGTFPRELAELSSIEIQRDPIFGAAAEPTWNGWKYFADTSSFSIYKYTGRGRETVWYTQATNDIGEWYIDPETGHRLKLQDPVQTQLR